MLISVIRSIPVHYPYLPFSDFGLLPAQHLEIFSNKTVSNVFRSLHCLARALPESIAEWSITTKDK